MPDEFHHLNAAARMKEVIKTAAAQVVSKDTPSRFIGWVLDSRYDADPNYGPLTVDMIGSASTDVKVATLQIPLMDGTAVVVEGAPCNYRIVDVLSTPYINYFQDTRYQTAVKLVDSFLSGRTGLIHNYDDYLDYPLGNDPFQDNPAINIVNLATTSGFEGGSVGAWAATAGTTIAVDTTRFKDGSHSGGITWSIGDVNARVTLPFDTEVGKTYTIMAWGWSTGGVPGGHPGAVNIGAGDGATGAATNNVFLTSGGQWRLTRVQYIATSAQSHVVIAPATAEATSGMSCWIDLITIHQGIGIIAPFNGASGGGAYWTGAADLSTSILPTPAVAKLFDSGPSVKYGSPIYVPFFSNSIEVGQNYYLGTWSTEQWDTPEAFAISDITSTGLTEITVKMYASHTGAAMPGTPDAFFDYGPVFCIKKYRFHANYQLSDSSSWNKIAPYFSTGPKNGVDIQLQIVPNGSGFSLRLMYLRDDERVNGRYPHFIGSISGWSDLENLSDTTELDPGNITKFGHRGTITTDLSPFIPGIQGVDGDFYEQAQASKGPFETPDMAVSRHGQSTLMGGGNVTWDGTNLKWTSNFYIRGLGKNYWTLATQFIVAPPTAGVSVHIYGKPSTTTVTTITGGVPLALGQALWFEPAWGSDQNTGWLRVVEGIDDLKHFQVPSHWVFLAEVNPDDSTIKLGTGVTVGGNATPSGVVNEFAGSTVPSGWLLCDGAAVSRTTYAALFTAIGTTYGVGDGSTTFNLPNVVNKVPRGGTPGITGGADTHTHPLSSNGQALIILGVTGNMALRSAAVSPTYTETVRRTGIGTAGTPAAGQGQGIELGGATDSASTLPAYVSFKYIIKI